jgi:hypothetical protein
LALAAVAGLLITNKIARADVLYDSITPINDHFANNVSNGIGITVNVGAPDTFIGGIYGISASAQEITGLDVSIDNATSYNSSTGGYNSPGTTFTALKETAYFWQTVSPGSNPVFSNYLGSRTIYFTSAPPPGYFTWYGENGGAVGANPTWSFGTNPLLLNSSGGSGTSTIGVAFNIQGTTDTISNGNYAAANYSNYQYLTTPITSGVAPTNGSNPSLYYFRNAAGLTNGNFNWSSDSRTISSSYVDVPVRIFGGSPVNYNWINLSGGNYTDSTCYSPSGAPTAIDNVFFNLSSSSPYTVTIPSQLVYASTVSIQNDNVVFDLPGTESQIYFSAALNVGVAQSTTSPITGNLLVESHTQLNSYGNLAEAGKIVIGGNGGTGTLTVAPLIYVYSDSDTSIAANSKIVVQQYGLFETQTLTFAGVSNAWQGKLDLNSGDVIVDNGSIATITNQLKSGYNGGAWNGSGIVSSAAANDSTHLTAVGALVNNDGSGNPLYGTNTSLGTFDQINNDPAVGAILLRYTYYGDANLDGKVDSADYVRIDNGFIGKLTGWQNGDFNYDGVVNGSDYTLIDNAFNMQGVNIVTGDAVSASVKFSDIAGVERPIGADNSASASDSVTADGSQVSAQSTAEIATSAVPEPTSLGLVALGAGCMLGRRARRK